jgi:RNA polymerase sigma factor FliA
MSKNQATAKASALLQKYKEEPSKITAEQKDKLIMEYAPLIKFIAQKIAVRLPAHIELDDLISSGVIGLMDAIEKYDPERDNKFKTYAEFRIRGAILDELRAQDWVPRSVRDKAKLLDRTIVNLEAELGRAPSDEEVAERLKISMDEYFDLVNQVRPVSVLSIDEASTFSSVDKMSILNLLESCKINNPFNQLNLKSIKTVVTKAIEDLPERQRLVLSLYYYEDLNLKEIGKVLRVTESRVSQLHAQAITRLRAKLTAHFDEAEAEAV